MSRTPPIIRKRDLHNVLAAVRAAGERISRVEIVDGRITVITMPEAETVNGESPEDTLLRAIDARKAALSNKAR